MPVKKGVYINCENCNTLVYKTQTEYKKSNHHFCSNECASKYRSIGIYEMRKCDICGAEFNVRIKYKQRFCSSKCQIEWQRSTNENKGENNHGYTRVKIKCETCDKEYYESRYKTKGNQHNFCSAQCRRKWYAEVFSQSDDWKEQSKIRAVNILEKGLVNKVNSKPQLIINQLLDSMKINYINEKGFNYYAVDNFLVNHNLIIEVMGDYWHTNPIRYDVVKYEKQKDRIIKDRRKHSYFVNQYNIEILYLWEYDIYNNIDLCKALINEYINSRGQLVNYHSFNYELYSNKLQPINNVIIPYQDRKAV